MRNDGFGLPADWNSRLEPWSSPTYLPGAPHNRPGGNSGGQLPQIFQPTTAPGGPSAEPPAPVTDNYRFAFINSQVVTVGVQSIKFLDQPIGRRNFLGFRNASATAVCYVDFSSNASNLSWLRIGPGQVVLFDSVVPQDDLYVISDTLLTPFTYAYSTYTP